MVQRANTVFRDYVTDGVPSSGANDPNKADIRAMLTALENGVSGAAAGATIYDSKADMDAETSQAANAMAWVLGDDTVANNGVYQFDGTSTWTRLGDLPYSYIKASNAGAGTANAIVATTSTPVPDADGGALVALPIVVNNTGAATVVFNGGTALTIKTSSGNDVAAGGLTSGMIVAGYVSGATFRLLTDQASAAIQAAAETAQVAAETAQSKAEDAQTAAETSAASIDPDTLVKKSATNTSSFGFVNTGTLADSGTTVPAENTVKNYVDDTAASLTTQITAAAAGAVVKATWVDLSTVTGTRDGQPGKVIADGGTHTDPVVGGTVANVGEYAWSAAVSAWQHVGALIDLSTRHLYPTKSSLATAAPSLSDGQYIVWADTNLTNNGLYEVISGTATLVGGDEDDELTRSAIDLSNQAEDYRTLGALKFTPSLTFLTTLGSAGATYWDGSTEVGATQTSGGMRIPEGQTGVAATLQAKAAIQTEWATAMAGRTARFVTVLETSDDWLEELTYSNGNLQLSLILDESGAGTSGALGLFRVRKRDTNTVAFEVDYTFVGDEKEIRSYLIVNAGNEAVSADCTAFVKSFEWFPLDDSGPLEVYDYHLPRAYDGAYTTMRIYQALQNGAVPFHHLRGFKVPVGKTGASSTFAAEMPLRGFPIGTHIRVVLTFATSFQFPAGTLVTNPPATVKMWDGTAPTASATLKVTSNYEQQAVIEYTIVGGEDVLSYPYFISPSAVARASDGTVELIGATVSVVAAPFGYNSAAIINRHREDMAAARVHQPFPDRIAVVNASGSADYPTIRQGTQALEIGESFDRTALVSVEAGIYASEVSPTLKIDPADYVDIVGAGEDATRLEAFFADSQASQDAVQGMLVRRSVKIRDLTVKGKNFRYPLHIEAAVYDGKAVQLFEDISVEHFGATGWASPTALGIGHHAGNRQTFRRVQAVSTTQAIGFHNNNDWYEPAMLEFWDGRLLALDDDGLAISASSLGAGVMSSATFRNTSLGGHARLTTNGWLSTDLRTHRANRYEYKVVLDNCSPIAWTSACDVEALELRSVAGSGSNVALSGTAVPYLFGAAPQYREGGVGFAARVYSLHAISLDVLDISISDPGVTLAARLGNRSSSPLTLSVSFDGGSAVNVTLDQDYSAMTNAQVVTSLNTALSTAMSGSTGGRSFYVSTPYQNRGPFFQPAREGFRKNNDTTAILKGHVLAWDGYSVRLMTSSDNVAEFAGIALDEAMPGRPCRFQRTGWISSVHPLFTGTPSIAAGDKFEIGATAGELVAGSTSPVLKSRSSVGFFGATLELL